MGTKDAEFNVDLESVERVAKNNETTQKTEKCIFLNVSHCRIPLYIHLRYGKLHCQKWSKSLYPNIHINV
jgi:hypothetical protein